MVTVQDSFAFYSESATQTSSPVYFGTLEDDNLSVNVWLCSYTVTARTKFGAPFFIPSCLLSLCCVVPNIGYSAQRKEQCLASLLLIFIIVRQRVRGSMRFRNPRLVAMVSERSEDTIPASRGFLNRVDPI